MRARQVQCLLMGGQACVLYGAAEFSRDTEVAAAHAEAAAAGAKARPLLSAAIAGNLAHLEQMLRDEELAERERDRHYWQPLRDELERLRHEQRRQPGP